MTRNEPKYIDRLRLGVELLYKLDDTEDGQLKFALLEAASQTLEPLVYKRHCPAPIRERARIILIHTILDHSENQFGHAQRLIWEAAAVPRLSEEWIELRLLDLEVALKTDHRIRADWLLDDPKLDGLSDEKLAEFGLLWYRYRGALPDKLAERILKSPLRGVLDMIEGNKSRKSRKLGANGSLYESWRLLSEGKAPAPVNGKLKQVTRIAYGDEEFTLKWPQLTLLEHTKSLVNGLAVYFGVGTSDALTELGSVKLSARPELIFLSVLVCHALGLKRERDIALDKLEQLTDNEHSLYQYCLGVLAHDSGAPLDADTAYKLAAEDSELEIYAGLSRQTLHLDVVELLRIKREAPPQSLVELCVLLIQGLVGYIEPLQVFEIRDFPMKAKPRQIAGLCEILLAIKHPVMIGTDAREEHLDAAAYYLGPAWQEVIDHARSLFGLN